MKDPKNDDKRARIEELFEKGLLVSEDILERNLEGTLLDKIETESDLIVINSDYADVIEQQASLVDWYEVDKQRVTAEKERDEELYQAQLQHFKKSQVSVVPLQQDEEGIEKVTFEVSSIEADLSVSTPASSFSTETSSVVEEEKGGAFVPSVSSAVTVVLSYENIPKKYAPDDFATFFMSRYRFIEGILRHRQELENTLSINRVSAKKEKENISVIGLVAEINETAKGNVILTLEDPTGRIKILIMKDKKDLYALSQDLVVDEVIGVSGTSGDNIIFANNIVWPDIPASHVLKKGPEEEYAVFLSDVHVGSKLFLGKEFGKFISWVNGTAGTEEQQQIARKVKYIFVAGDLVDGVGIYPSQEEELEIPDIKGQYAEFARLISQISKDKQIILCPGNHDCVHLAEPQPVFYQEFAPDLFTLPNVTAVTNPAIVNIGKKEGFEGFDVLLYHGYSFDYYVANVSSIRTGGGYHRSDLIMKFLLKRRHLAPSFTSTPYYPSHDEDPLLIKKIPDFFITGHIHYSSVANYKGVTMISGSCWQAKTSFQEKLGHEPEPARVPVVNLKTREIKILRFG
ncbi:DNA polymerase II [Candidatus Woesearchaeota archaeon CG10_big_fil_rev_8_21_14_0_10_45_16]|nr:MAG: DNA polymerase II [Candidatus Woesearchaeota archaeon CG10_big_fil_rev_8_21_14_0_10_45_16]